MGSFRSDLARWQRAVSRRRALAMLGAATTVPLLGCGDDSRSGADAGDPGCFAIPSETAGPFPGDGTNGPNVLADSGVVRSDIRASFGGATGVADGLVLALSFQLIDSSCSPLANRAIYAWQCDRDGNYSLYSDAVLGENYLRGVQESDDSGVVTFTTIVPGCYPGRWPHVHFEVYSSLAAATSGANALATSQLAFPEAMCREAYATAGYEGSAVNLTPLSIETDSVFSDGADRQIASVSGSPAAGYAASLEVPV